MKVTFRGLFIERVGLTVLNGDRVFRTLSKARAESIAVYFAYQSGFAVYYLNGTLGARRYAQAAAITFFFVDLYDFPKWHFSCSYIHLLIHLIWYLSGNR